MGYVKGMEGVFGEEGCNCVVIIRGLGFEGGVGD